MHLSLPQTYLIGLGGLLSIIAILVGRQLLRVRKNESDLVKLEKINLKNPTDAAKLYELGSAQINKRLYPQATISLKSALKALTDEPPEACALIENALGFSLAAQENFKESIMHYKNAIKVKSDYPVALNNLAYAKQKLLEEDEALEIYKQVLQIDPKNKTAKKQVKRITKLRENNSKNISYKKGF